MATAWTPPATIYVALFTAAPTDAGGGTEVTGGSYARKAVTNNPTNWPAAAGGVKSNGVVITFVTPTGAWGTVTHFALMDAASAGNQIANGALTVPRAIAIGDVPAFAAGTLAVALD